MGNIAIAKETIRITDERKFECGGRTVSLPALDYAAAEVIRPEDAEALLQADLTEFQLDAPCRITVTTEDTFTAAKRLRPALALNFANAHHAGGGFLLGANAQEEALCRCSTLYASIKSEAAAEMYRYNNTHLKAVESDYMLYSPNVCVFRDHHCSLTDDFFQAAVITAPAPNRRGAAVLAGETLLRETFLRRFRIILRFAALHGFRNVVLGAWGCGAFGNSPKMVAECSAEALRDGGLANCFTEVCFAVYGKETSRNYQAFAAQFAGQTADQ